ncbi:hypothetical protein LINPERHAP1_LOCUS11394, partial [Linum perenne]
PVLASLLLADPLLPPPDCVAAASEELDLLEAEGQTCFDSTLKMLRDSRSLSPYLMCTCFDICIESLLIRRRERGLVDWRRRGMRCRGREGGLGIWVIGLRN